MHVNQHLAFSPKPSIILIYKQKSLCPFTFIPASKFVSGGTFQKPHNLVSGGGGGAGRRRKIEKKRKSHLIIKLQMQLVTLPRNGDQTQAAPV